MFQKQFSSNVPGFLRVQKHLFPRDGLRSRQAGTRWRPSPRQAHGRALASLTAWPLPLSVPRLPAPRARRGPRLPRDDRCREEQRGRGSAGGQSTGLPTGAGRWRQRPPLPWRGLGSSGSAHTGPGSRSCPGLASRGKRAQQSCAIPSLLICALTPFKAYILLLLSFLQCSPLASLTTSSPTSTVSAFNTQYKKVITLIASRFTKIRRQKDSSLLFFPASTG